MTDHIPLTDCVKGHIYRLHSRNLFVGVFDGEKGFIGIREKFGSEYLFTEYHWDTDPYVGTARPVADLGVLPDHISVAERFGPFCVAHHLEWEWDYQAQAKAGRHPDGSPCERLPDSPSWDAIPNTALFDHLKPFAQEEARLFLESLNPKEKE